MPEAFPLPSELLPHSGRAVLLERVVAHDDTTTVCLVDPYADSRFRDSEGRVPAWIGLEYMAQAIAAHGGLLDLAAGRERRPGFFLGSRRLVFTVDSFPAGVRLSVRVRHHRGSRGMLAFDCAIHDAAASEDDAAAMVSGILTVYLLESFDALQRDFSGDD
jgi:predicted hotdog family 3-hydroxylacyl-ACP dehydratase